MMKINSYLQDQTQFSFSAGFAISLGCVGLSYLIFRYLTAPKQELEPACIPSQKQYGKVFVICPKSASQEDLSYAKRMAQIVRKVFPENAKIVLQLTDDIYQKALDAHLRAEKTFFSELEIVTRPINLSHMPFDEAQDTYVFHDSILKGVDPYPLSEDHLIDIGEKTTTSTASSVTRFSQTGIKKNGVYCLEEKDIADRFENRCLRNYNSAFSQKAVYEELDEARSAYQDWDPLLFFINAAIAAQDKKLFYLYVPGSQFISSDVLPVFLESLLEIVKDHPNKPGKIQVYLPTDLLSQMSVGGALGEIDVPDPTLNVSCVTFSIDPSIDKAMRLFFLGAISERDKAKLHWEVQNQIRNKSFDALDMSFSEWLSCNAQDLDYLIQAAKDYSLLYLKEFLEDFRRDVPTAFSFESCQKFAQAWMDRTLQQEAQTLREILKKESDSSLLIQQKLSEIK